MKANFTEPLTNTFHPLTLSVFPAGQPCKAHNHFGSQHYFHLPVRAVCHVHKQSVNAIAIAIDHPLVKRPPTVVRFAFIKVLAALLTMPYAFPAAESLTCQ